MWVTVYNRHVDQVEKIGQNLTLHLEEPYSGIVSDLEDEVNQQPVEQRQQQAVHVPQLKRSTRERMPNKLYSNDRYLLNK